MPPPVTPLMSWQEMHPWPFLPVERSPGFELRGGERPASCIACRAWSPPSGRASARKPTLCAAVLRHAEASSTGRARPPPVRTDCSHAVRALCPIWVSRGGWTSSAFSAFSSSRIWSASSPPMPPSPSRWWQFRQLNRLSGDPGGVGRRFRPGPGQPVLEERGECVAVRGLERVDGDLPGSGFAARQPVAGLRPCG